MASSVYAWVRKSGNYWKAVSWGLWTGVFGYFGLLIAVLLALGTIFVDRLWIGSLVIIGVYLVGRLIEMYLLYCRVKCPACGHNPTRTKKDGKWMSPRALYWQLEKYERCPKCGDDGTR